MKLTDRQKAFIVERLAVFDSPKTVALSFKEEFGVPIDRRHVSNYDVEKRFGHVNEKLRKLFWATRKNFLVAAGAIPIAQRAYRLRRLQHIHEDMFDRGNMVGAAAILEQAAKEAGDVFTNTTKHTGKVKVEADDDLTFLAQEKRATLAELVEQALRKTTPADDETKH